MALNSLFCADVSLRNYSHPHPLLSLYVLHSVNICYAYSFYSLTFAVVGRRV